MRLTKMGHACVRLEKDGEILVIDPGTLTEPDALDAAEAVLITHEHPDHVDRDRLEIAAQRTRQLEIWTTRRSQGNSRGSARTSTPSAGATPSVQPGSTWACSVNSMQ